jgi:hypothetical protein
MALNTNQIEMMQEEMTAELIKRLMKARNIPMEEAFKDLYNSRTYEALQRPETGLYFQSPGYVYAYLEEELKSIHS